MSARFRPIRLLGRGGQGAVWLVYDREFQCDVAVKLFPVGSGPGEEAALLRKARGAHFVQVYEVHRDATHPFIVMEHVPGESLKDRLASGALGLDELLRIAAGVAEGLGTLHHLPGNWLLHLDVKPGNILIGDDGIVRVIDFGVAMSEWIRCEDGTSMRRNVGPAPGGSPGYMSPEQLARDRVDRRADIWSFGCVLFVCLTLRLPFADGAAENDACVRQPGALPRMHLLPEIPAALRSLIARCLHLEPERRPRDIDDVLREIEQLARGGTVGGVDGAISNLNHAVDRVVGRATERRELIACVTAEPVFVLHGLPGIGKSSLARVAAAEIARDSLRWSLVCWIALGRQPSRDGERVVVDAVTEALDRMLPSARPAGAAPRTPIAERLARRPPGRALIVLDNADDLPAGVAAAVRDACGCDEHVHLLVTSSRPLPLPGARSMRLGPLSLEGGIDSDACSVFIDRVNAYDHRFRRESLKGSERQAIVDICALADGLPLALCLLAPWAAAGGLGEVASRIESLESLDQVVMAALDRLGERAALVLSRLSVCTGGWTESLGHRVVDDQATGLARAQFDEVHLELVQHGFIEQVRLTRRFRMLHPVRVVASKLLSTRDDRVATERRLVRAMANLVDPASAARVEEGVRFAEIEREFDNVRAAFDAALRLGDDESLFRLASRLGLFFWTRGRAAEGRGMLERGLARAVALGDPRATAHVATALGLTCLRPDASHLGPDDAFMAARAHLRLARRISTHSAAGQSGEALQEARRQEIKALHNLALAQRKLRRFRQAARTLAVAEVRMADLPTQDPRTIALRWQVRLAEGVLEKERGNLERASVLFEEIRRQWPQPGRSQEANLRENIGETCCLLGRFDEAVPNLGAAAKGFAATRNRPERIRNMLWRSVAALALAELAGARRLHGAVRRCVDVTPLDPFHAEVERDVARRL